MCLCRHPPDQSDLPFFVSRPQKGQAFTVRVNSVCPGWVRTDMGGSSAPRSVEEGADTGVWLALDANQNLTGRFFRDRQEIPW